MIEDDCSSISMLDIYKNHIKKLASMGKMNIDLKFLQMFEAGDLPLAKYYEKIQSLTSSTVVNKQFFIELFKNITNNLVPKNLLKEWAQYTYTDATDYFHFRKIFTQQLAIYNLAEYALCLTRLNPDQFYLSQNNGIIQAIRLKFDLNEQINNPNPPSTLCQYIDDFNTDRIVPFRLTPNISEFIGSAGVNGPMGIIKIALARCLVQPQYQFIWLLRAIMKDEILTIIYKKV
jgi:transformation/transcription domain-associated protein